MADNIRLLEELVTEAVNRLEGLSEDGNGLREKVTALRKRLDAMKLEASRGDRGTDAERAWQGRQAQALSMVQEALSELRGN